MKSMIRIMAIAAGLLATQGVLGTAQAPPSGAPAGATGLCKDGTYWTGASKQGACRGHSGVKDWYTSATPAASPAPASKSTATPTPAPAATPMPAPASKPAAASTKPATTNSTKTPAAGGGPGLVWVNTSSKVYHCYGKEDYGTTKQGKYMSEADAKAMGAHADHGNACSK